MPGKKLCDDWTHPSLAISTAYEICLHVEKEFMRQNTPNLPKDDAEALEKNLVNIRILGYLLVFGPTDTSREHVARMILADAGRGLDEIINRGRFYDEFFLRSCQFSPSQLSPEANLKTIQFARPKVVPPNSTLTRRPPASHPLTWRVRPRNSFLTTRKPRRV